MAVDVEQVSQILTDAAERFILPRYKALAEHEISAKTNPRDLVTQADLDVEEHLMRLLPDFLAGSVVVGEEGASRDPAMLDVLKEPGQKIWIVDPVDGTHNFVHHKREFGVMLACIIDGRAEYAWIYDVLGRVMVTAARGAGAFIGDQKLAVITVESPAELTGHLNPHYFPQSMRSGLKQAKADIRDCRSLHCAAHEYLRLARGEAQFCIYSRLKPWDHVAGSLVVEEAGGYVAKWDGKPYRPRDCDVGLIAAASRENWQMAYDVFLKGKIPSASA